MPRESATSIRVSTRHVGRILSLNDTNAMDISRLSRCLASKQQEHCRRPLLTNVTAKCCKRAWALEALCQKKEIPSDAQLDPNRCGQPSYFTYLSLFSIVPISELWGYVALYEHHIKKYICLQTTPYVCRSFRGLSAAALYYCIMQREHDEKSPACALDFTVFPLLFFFRWSRFADVGVCSRCCYVCVRRTGMEAPEQEDQGRGSVSPPVRDYEKKTTAVKSKIWSKVIFASCVCH